MNPRKFVIAAVALVAMVTVAKYTGCFDFPTLPPEAYNRINQPQPLPQPVQGNGLMLPFQLPNTSGAPLAPIAGLTEIKGMTPEQQQFLQEAENRNSYWHQLQNLTPELKTEFDNWLRQNGMNPESMTPLKKMGYIGSFKMMKSGIYNN
jgi:hypothetical protein